MPRTLKPWSVEIGGITGQSGRISTKSGHPDTSWRAFAAANSSGNRFRSGGRRIDTASRAVMCTAPFGTELTKLLLLAGRYIAHVPGRIATPGVEWAFI